MSARDDYTLLQLHRRPDDTWEAMCAEIDELRLQLEHYRLTHTEDEDMHNPPTVWDDIHKYNSDFPETRHATSQGIEIYGFPT